MSNPASTPANLDIQKDRGLTVLWSDGTQTFYPVAYLRKWSPSADMRHLREQMKKNPLTVLPASVARASGPLLIRSAELVGNYALKIEFSDGHGSGIYSWEYLRQIDPGNPDHKTGQTTGQAPDAGGNSPRPPAKDGASGPTPA